MAFRQIPAEMRVEVAQAFVTTGSVRGTARQTGLPPSTVSRWLRGPAGVELRAAADAFRARTEIEINRAWLEELRQPQRAPVAEIFRRINGLRDGLVREEMRKARSRRRRTAVAPAA